MITHIKTLLNRLADVVSDWLLPIAVFILLLCILFLPVRKYNRELRKQLMSIESKVNENTMTIPEGSQVYIVQPQGEQEVIIIGDPDDITVKPKKRTNK